MKCRQGRFRERQLIGHLNFSRRKAGALLCQQRYGSDKPTLSPDRTSDHIHKTAVHQLADTLILGLTVKLLQVDMNPLLILLHPCKKFIREPVPSLVGRQNTARGYKERP